MDTGGGIGPAAGGASGRRDSADPGLGPGVEFDLIRRFFPGGRHLSPRTDVLVGAGDDAAVVVGKNIVLSSDLSLEDIHFRRGWMTPREIGNRAAVAALSDLAAMAARPIGVLASLALSAGDATETAEEIMAGVSDAVEGVGGVLLGGDLSRSAGGIVLDIVAVGEVEVPVVRGGARDGDELWVTGELGGAALAVASLLRSEAPDTDAMQRFSAPVPRIGEARWLAERGLPTAMLDLSDGLAGDARHIARASGVAIILEPHLLPIHPSVRRSITDEREARALALSGGEDYELCFTAPEGVVIRYAAEFQRVWGIQLVRVGRVAAGEGVHTREPSGQPIPLMVGGFQHFEDAGGIRGG